MKRESFMEAAKAQNWAVQPQERNQCFSYGRKKEEAN
jgi:hypothetical protein